MQSPETLRFLIKVKLSELQSPARLQTDALPGASIDGWSAYLIGSCHVDSRKNAGPAGPTCC